MACNYIITLQNGTELVLSTDFDQHDPNISAFENTLKGINEKELKDILKKIESSSKKAISIETFEKLSNKDDLHIGTVNVIGTTSIDELTNSLKISKNNTDLENSFIKSIQKTKDFLKGVDVNVTNNNIIASNFTESDPKNLTAKFYSEGNGFLIYDNNDIQKGKYLNLLKGLVDYSIFKLDDVSPLTTQFDFLNLKSKEDVINYFKFLPNTFDNKNTTQLRAVVTLENLLNLPIDSLKNLYFFHTIVPKVEFTREGKINRDETILNESNKIYLKYSPLLENKDWYYSGKLTSSSFPALSPGDLIKFNPTFNEGSQKYTNLDEKGFYYIYIDTIQKSIGGGNYETQYAIKDPKTGDLKYVSENKLKFPNEEYNFVYQKNENNVPFKFTEKELNVNTPFSSVLNINESNKDNKDIQSKLTTNQKVIDNLKENYILSNLDGYLDKDSLNKLINGDLIFKRTGDVNLIYTVIKVFPNSIYIKSKDGKFSNITKTAVNIKDPLDPNKQKTIYTWNINGFAFNKENHPDLVNIQENGLLEGLTAGQGFYTNEKGFVFNKVTTENKENLLKGVNIGDIVFSKTDSGTFHNLILGFNNTRTEFSILTKNGTMKINADNIINVIFNLSDSLSKINEAKIEQPIILQDLKNTDSSTYNSTFDIIDVNNKSDYTNNLKLQIKNGDYIMFGGKLQLVLTTYSDKLKLFDLNKNVTFIPLENVEKIIKKDSNLSKFEYNTVMLNNYRYDTENKLQEIANTNNNLEVIEMKYVKYSDKHAKFNKEYNNTLDSNHNIINDNTGLIKGSHWISKEKYDLSPEKYIDITNNYSKHIFGDTIKIFSVKYTDTNGFQTIKNQTYHKSIKNLSSFKSEWFFNNVTQGMFVQLGKSDTGYDNKIYRIENVIKSGNQGLYLSYSKVNDETGRLTNIIKFVSKAQIEDEIGNLNLNKLLIPSNFNTINKFIPEITPLNVKTLSKGKVLEKDRINVISNISNYIDNTFGIKTELISNSSPELEEYKKKLQIESLDDIKAFILNGTIYINTDTATIVEPLHELMHLIFGSLKTLNPQLYLSILGNISNHPSYSQLGDNYKNLTYLDKNEEVAVKLLTEDVLGSLISYKGFNTDEFNNAIKNSINTVFNLEKDLSDYNYRDLLNMSPLDLINDFSSNLFTNTKDYFNLQSALDAIKVTSIKRELMEQNKLTEECLW